MDIPASLAAIGLKDTVLQAAAIQGLLALIGIVLTGIIGSFAYGRSRRADRRVQRLLREEKTRDLQSAIRAEARAHWYELDGHGDLDQACDAIVEKIEEGRWTQPGFTPFVPKEAPSVVLEAIEADIAILDHDVISAAMYYYRLLALVAQFSDDLRSDFFRALPADRKIEMVRSYFAMLQGLKNASARLNAELEAALALPEADPNMRASVPPTAWPHRANPASRPASPASASTVRLDEP
jgi:hypothetical protein